MNIAVLFGSFILMMALPVPVGYAIGIATFITLSCFSNIPVALITQNAITGCDSFPLMAIPFFMLAGNLMSSGGIAKRIVDFADTLLGWIQGGLCIVTTIACMFFAAISGSAMATTSAIGGGEARLQPAVQRGPGRFGRNHRRYYSSQYSLCYLRRCCGRVHQ